MSGWEDTKTGRSSSGFHQTIALDAAAIHRALDGLYREKNVIESIIHPAILHATEEFESTNNEQEARNILYERILKNATDVLLTALVEEREKVKVESEISDKQRS